MIAGMELMDAILIAGAGVVAGIVNAMAGGGSLLTVGFLNVFAGLPGFCLLYTSPSPRDRG